MIDEYDWGGGREALMRFGSGNPVVILALPPFEETNRTRSFGVTLLRMLADRGVGGVLPDLPGMGESLVPTRQATLAGWRAAFSQAAKTTGARHGIAIRGGALIDTVALLDSRWHLSPQDGQMLTRELERMRSASDTPGDGYGGNDIGEAMMSALRPAQPASEKVRTVRLATDKRPADRWVDAAPLWRRAEPDNDLELADKLVPDIHKWVRQCGG